MRGAEGDGELNSFLFFLLNTCLILISVFLERRAFIVFGGIGVTWYLGHLAYDVFEDSLLFPIALSMIGVAVIVVGIQYQKHAAAISSRVASFLPARWRWLHPQNRKV